MSTPPPGELGPGSILDRYTIVRHVARGGMGSVWLARFEGKHGFSKQVAIKTIAAEFAGNAQFHAMFLEEARISSKLAHANIAQVLDVGDYDGGMFIAFEWVDGRPLEQICRAAEADGDFVPIPLLLRVLADACAGLHAAHELRDDAGQPLGIVHRDVTPGNILVADNGAAKVIDFGIAKSRDRVHGETRSGFVKGTPQYMSPEHACREPVDRRADIWSIGAVLFRALAGRAPFRDHEALLDYMDGVSSLPTLRSDVTPDVSAIVARALAVDRTKRFANAEEVRHALERALHAGGTSQEALSAMVSRLATTSPEVPINPHAPTELAVPSVAPPPIAIPASPANPSLPTLVSPQAQPRSSEGDSMTPLVIAVVIAAIVALGSVLLAFCG